MTPDQFLEKRGVELGKVLQANKVDLLRRRDREEEAGRAEGVRVLSEEIEVVHQIQSDLNRVRPAAPVR